MDVRIPETPPPPLSANLLPPLSADVFYEQPLSNYNLQVHWGKIIINIKMYLQDNDSVAGYLWNRDKHLSS